MGAVWAQRDSNLGTEAASTYWPPVRGGALRVSGQERLSSSRCTWQPEVPCSARPAGGLAGKHGTTLTQMMRLSHSGSSGCGSGCGSSMVREPRRRAHRDGRASNRARSTTSALATGARRPGPAPAPLTREASRGRRRGTTAPRPPRPSRAAAPEPAPPADRTPHAE